MLCSIGLTMPNYVFNEDRYFRGCLLAPTNTPMKEAVRAIVEASGYHHMTSSEGPSRRPYRISPEQKNQLKEDGENWQV